MMAICGCPPMTWALPGSEKKVKSVAIGIIAGIVAFSAIAGISYALSKRFPNFKLSQDVSRIFTLFKNIPVLNHIWRAVWRLFVVFLGPILEETLFRGLLTTKIKEGFGDDSTSKKVLRIAGVALLFGVAHLSPFQSGISNLVIFGITASLGLALGVLQQARGDLLAPTAMHMAYNLAATL